MKLNSNYKKCPKCGIVRNLKEAKECPVCISGWTPGKTKGYGVRIKDNNVKRKYG